MLLSEILFILLFLIFLFITYYYIKSQKQKIIQNYIALKNNLKALKNKPLIILGPSGVGKDTFMDKLIIKHQNKIKKCVSWTTRTPRANEKDGINYYYIKKEKFLELEKNGDIIGKLEKYDNFYGTSKQILENMLAKDEIIYFDYNIETAIKMFNEKKIEFNYIAFLPPSIEELEKRLKNRNTDDEESIKKRITYAKKKIELIKENKFINYVIVNDIFEKSFKEFENCFAKLYSNLLE